MNIKKVKIIATIGPASRSPEMLEKLAESGVNVFRINFSHEKHDTAEVLISDIRALERTLERPLAIMGDLCGPKIRIGEVEPGTMLSAGDTIEIVEEEVMGNKEKISLNYPSIVKKFKEGAEIYIDDGKLKLKVVKPTENGILATVTAGGELKARKGFFGQGIELELNGLTDKDQRDLDFLLTQDIDAIALSFVNNAEYIKTVRKLLPSENTPWIVTKLETSQGIEDIDAIIDATDVLMLARGDMGLAVPMEEVPHLQKKLIQKCLVKAKPVITATQMLESMTTNSLPTRAEVTDVANAIIDGTDAVMLSAETASGAFPVETVQMMSRIIKRALPHIPAFDYHEQHDTTHAISAHVGEIANQVGTKLVVALTESGATARRISRHRNSQAIIALSPEIKTVRRLNFSYGVYSRLISPVSGFMDMTKIAKQAAVSNKIVPLELGEPFVICAGMPFGKSGSTNLILIEKV